LNIAADAAIARRRCEHVLDGMLYFDGTIAAANTKHIVLLPGLGSMTTSLFSAAPDCATGNCDCLPDELQPTDFSLAVF
jgi:hypothetical protein